MQNINENIRLTNTIKLIISFKPYWLEMFLTLFLNLIKFLSLATSVGVTSYMVGLSMEHKLSDKFNFLIIILISCIFIRALAYFGELWFAHDLAFKVLRDTRIRVFDVIEKISPSFTLKNHTGNIGSTLMSDIELLEWFLAHTFATSIAAILIAISIISIIFIINTFLALITLLFVLLILLIPFIFRRNADKIGLKTRNALAESNSVIIEAIHGIKELLTLTNKQYYCDKIFKYLSKLYENQFTYIKREAMEESAMIVLLGLFMVTVMGLSATMVHAGSLSFTMYPVVLILSGVIFSPLVEVCKVARNFGNIFAAAERVQSVLSSVPQVQDMGEPVSKAELVAELAFDDVSFSYGTGLAEVLHHVNFQAQPGKITALVGPSGAGKTTCLNLILRYWNPVSGRVSIGGRDLRSISLASLRELSCAVLQDVYLFNTSIRDNISLGRTNATHDEIVEAARQAYAHDFIMNLPNQYDTMTGERGFKLSGGQRQRLTIARAILRDLPILILDEAVSNLDTESEYFIAKTIKEQAFKRTIVLVAHRLSTIKWADLLLVIDNGEVIQTGTYDYLINTDGFFKEFISQQLIKNTV
jgi:ABC-type multidrug transport system fused ATPase/permease subunit